MEAANLGAFLADRSDADREPPWMHSPTRRPGPTTGPATCGVADDIRERFAPGGESLAIPTWVTAGEPISQFASHIAKYFSNSIREDGLLAVATAGIVFAPGGAGTMQEIFQDAAQNAYRTLRPQPDGVPRHAGTTARRPASTRRCSGRRSGWASPTS